nr:hypothetical protein [Tanacetum cinerariifolium]
MWYAVAFGCIIIEERFHTAKIWLGDSEQKAHEFIHIYLASASVYVWIGIETTKEGTKILATIDGRTVPIFPSMLVTMGEGSGTPTKPHHTPTPEATPSPQHELSSSSLPPVITESLPTVIPFDNPSLRQYTKRTRIAQSSVLPPVVDEPASPLGDDSQGKAYPTGSGFGADQDR